MKTQPKNRFKRAKGMNPNADKTRKGIMNRGNKPKAQRHDTQ